MKLVPGNGGCSLKSHVLLLEVCRLRWHSQASWLGDHSQREVWGVSGCFAEHPKCVRHLARHTDHLSLFTSGCGALFGDRRTFEPRIVGGYPLPQLSQDCERPSIAPAIWKEQSRAEGPKCEQALQVPQLQAHECK